VHAIALDADMAVNGKREFREILMEKNPEIIADIWGTSSEMHASLGYYISCSLFSLLSLWTLHFPFILP
jgi:hypothetical protein